MSDSAEVTTPRSNAAPLLALFGAVLLLVSPFLTWFSGVGSAWKVLEFVDVAVVIVAGAAILVCTTRLLGVGGPPNRTRLLAAGAVGLLLVLATLSEPPPAALEADTAFGGWLALIASLIILAAGALDLARLSINVSVSAQREQSVPPAPAPNDGAAVPAAASSQAETVIAREPALFRPEQPTPPVTPADLQRLPPPQGTPGPSGPA